MAKGITKIERKRVVDIAEKLKPKQLPELYAKDDFGRNRGQVLLQWKTEISDQADVSLNRAGTAIHVVLSKHAKQYGKLSW